jgi:hypothetical protein
MTAMDLNRRAHGRFHGFSSNIFQESLVACIGIMPAPEQHPDSGSLGFLPRRDALLVASDFNRQ